MVMNLRAGDTPVTIWRLSVGTAIVLAARTGCARAMDGFFSGPVSIIETDGPMEAAK